MYYGIGGLEDWKIVWRADNPKGVWAQLKTKLTNHDGLDHSGPNVKTF
jgi:hypothetical protein